MKLYSNYLLLGFVFAELFAHVAAAAERPNIVFIFADDHAAWATGHAGHPNAITPNMDRIYREGADFVNAFTTTPVCSPSRAGLIASRYGTEVGITEWINPRTESQLGLDPALPVWPRFLADAGYHTGLVGKWHLGTEKRFHPTKFGYQYFMGFRAGGTTPKDPILEVNGDERKVEGYVVDIVTDDAIAFLNREKAGPFVLSLHFREPHSPWIPIRDEYAAPFKGLDPKVPNPDFPKLDVPKVKEMTTKYLASIHGLDRNIGRVLDELDRLDLAKNTIVIYSSDHGYNMGHHGIWHKGNGRWILTQNPPDAPNVPGPQRPNMYDNSLRVPLAIRWPGVIKPGTAITQTVSNLDWFPTLLEMAGVKVPSDAKVHGKSFVPVIRGTAADWNNDLYAQYSTHDESHTHMRAYRTPEWKLIRDFLNEGRDEFYDLKTDPAEMTNLVTSTEAKATAAKAALNEKLIARMKELHDPALAGHK